MNNSPQSRSAHPRRIRIAAKVSIALSVTALLCLASTLSAAHAQSAPCGITQLPPTTTKIYPPIAKAAHVSGTVILLASMNYDGTPNVTKIVSGPEMLKKAAVQLVESSKADPSTGTRECPIVVSFELEVGKDLCDIPAEPQIPFTAKDAQHLTAYGRVIPICDPGGTLTTRHHLLFFHWNTTT